MIAQFFVPGVPVAQPRPRACMRGRHAGMYDPGTADDWKRAVKAAARPHVPATPIASGARVCINFWMPRPQAHYKRGEVRATAPDAHTGKPDADNIAKAVLDALTAADMWRDDACVWSLTVRKVYGHRAGADVCVEW